MPGPPDKFTAINLTGVAPGPDTANALTAGYTAFLAQFGVYPTVAIPIGNFVYIGAY